MAKLSVVAQTKTDTLKEFLKEEVLTDLESFSSIKLLSSSMGSGSLSDIMESSTPVYVKNYGKGQLATVSIRGNGASQTQLFWNGFKMNSPTLGQTDLSLIPLFFITDAQLNYSGASSIDGSGGIGGSIKLSNKLQWKKGVHGVLNQDFGSFKNSTSSASFSFGNKKSFHQLKIFYRQGLNNFEFVDISKPDKPAAIQENNGLMQYGLQYEMGVQLDKKNLLQATVLFFDSDRELPPIIGAVKNGERQKDQNLKSFLSWKSFQENFNSDLRFSFFSEKLNYTDSVSQLFSEVNVATFQGQYRINFQLWNGINFETSLQAAYNEVLSTGFDGFKTRLESGVYVKASKTFKKMNVEVFARQEQVDDNSSPLVYGAGAVYNVKSEKLKIRGNFSTNYRVPTLNDLYWNPGGNENLEPEKGWTAEVGIENKSEFKNKTRKRSLDFGAVLFYNQTNNWIQWVPTDFGYWQPSNVKSIENKGIEASASFSTPVGSKSNLAAHLFYTYTDSKNLSFANSSKDLVEKQTIYVPKHKSNLSLRYYINNFALFYTQIYNSQVFIDASNSTYLPHFFPANAGVNYRASIAKQIINVSFRVINIYNEQYHVTANRPLPGRNYELNLTLRF